MIERIETDPVRLSHGRWNPATEQYTREGDIIASYSGDTIGMAGRVRRPFSLNSAFWIATSVGPSGKEAAIAMSNEIIKVDVKPASLARADVPVVIAEHGDAARFAYFEDFLAGIDNENTLKNYKRAVDRFLAHCESEGLALHQVMPTHVKSYIQGLTSNRTDRDGNPKKASKPMRLLHLTAIRQLFDHLVTRHAIVINPAASVKGPRHAVRKGKTPALSPQQAESVLWAISGDDIVTARDRAAIGVLVWTARRASAVANLKLGDYYTDGNRWFLRFDDKGGEVFDIPVRHDLQEFLNAYIDAAGLAGEPEDAPLFRTAYKRTKQLTPKSMNGKDLYYMAKRRFADAGLPSKFTTHTFRSTVATDLLKQGVALDVVQNFLGHKDPRTTQLYDQRQHEVSQNVVERISVRAKPA